MTILPLPTTDEPTEAVTDITRFPFWNQILCGLNAFKENADEARYLKETADFVAALVERAKRSAPAR